MLPDDPSDLPAMRQMCLKVATDAAKLGAAIMLEKLGADVVQTKANELSKFLASRAREFGVHEVAIDVSLAPSTPDNGE